MTEAWNCHLNWNSFDTCKLSQEYSKSLKLIYMHINSRRGAWDLISQNDVNDFVSLRISINLPRNIGKFIVQRKITTSLVEFNFETDVL